MLLLVLLCSDSWETCLFPAVSIAIAACQRNLYYTFFFSVRNAMCGVWAWELVEMRVSSDLRALIFSIKPNSPAAQVAVAMVASVNTIVAWSMGVMSSMINCACGSLQERELFTQQYVDRPHLKSNMNSQTKNRIWAVNQNCALRPAVWT